MVRLSITDTGPGISEPDQQKLFQKFSRITNTNHEISFIDGTGLGLYLTKKYTELMNGHIGLTSAVGKGSTFWVELPKS
jgi:signal transduction histidine kinase